jgi:hypothetical protein
MGKMLWWLFYRGIYGTQIKKTLDLCFGSLKVWAWLHLLWHAEVSPQTQTKTVFGLLIVQEKGGLRACLSEV